MGISFLRPRPWHPLVTADCQVCRPSRRVPINRAGFAMGPPPFEDLIEPLLRGIDENDRGHRSRWRRSAIASRTGRNRPALIASNPRSSASFSRASSASVISSSASARTRSTSPSGSPGGASPVMRPFSMRTRIAFICRENTSSNAPRERSVADGPVALGSRRARLGMAPASLSRWITRRRQRVARLSTSRPTPWRMRGSNPRPSACKADALPLS